MIAGETVTFLDVVQFLRYRQNPLFTLDDGIMDIARRYRVADDMGSIVLPFLNKECPDNSANTSSQCSSSPGKPIDTYESEPATDIRENIRDFANLITSASYTATDEDSCVQILEGLRELYEKFAVNLQGNPSSLPLTPLEKRYIKKRATESTTPKLPTKKKKLFKTPRLTKFFRLPTRKNRQILTRESEGVRDMNPELQEVSQRAKEHWSAAAALLRKYTLHFCAHAVWSSAREVLFHVFHHVFVIVELSDNSDTGKPIRRSRKNCSSLLASELCEYVCICICTFSYCVCLYKLYGSLIAVTVID